MTEQLPENEQKIGEIVEKITISAVFNLRPTEIAYLEISKDLSTFDV